MYIQEVLRDSTSTAQCCLAPSTSTSSLQPTLNLQTSKDAQDDVDDRRGWGRRGWGVQVCGGGGAWKGTTEGVRVCGGDRRGWGRHDEDGEVLKGATEGVWVRGGNRKGGAMGRGLVGWGEGGGAGVGAVGTSRGQWGRRLGGGDSERVVGPARGQWGW
ncbi:hypothetical protein K439DRAFT_1620096 [Ramaria rubella]|nr:hypothetical protein K439DRAFT_1620096 [Ramaria rubella]